LQEAVKYIKTNLTVPVDTLGRPNLVNAAKTSMSSKILGPESDFFSELAVDAVTAVRTESTGEVSCSSSCFQHVLYCFQRLLCCEYM
jgi:T-complex protein 1 subunit alpha